MFNSLFTSKAIRFRKFKNKGYAAFASMHREVTIGHVSRRVCDMELLKAGKKVAVCSLALTLGAAATAAASVPPDSGDIAERLLLQEVQVTATAQLSSTARPVIVINHEQIVSLPINSAADVLKQIPSLDVRERGATGVQADISLRGSTPDQTIVMLNGINLTDVQTGHYSLDIPLTGDEIERVEVYASTATGLGAYAGVINIVTRKPLAALPDSDHTAVSLSLKGGEYGLFAPSAAVYHATPDILSTTTAGYNQTTGFAPNTDYKIASAFTHLTYKDLVQWQAGVQYKDAGANAFYALAYPNQFDATRTAFTSLAYRQVFARHWSVEADASYRAHYDRFELFRAMTDAPAWYTGHNTHTTHHANADLKLSYIHSWGTTTVGLTAQDAAITSNTLGEHNRFTLNYFAQQSVQKGKWSATLLAGGTYNTAFGSDWSVAADVNYSPLRSVMIYANASRALRLPTFTDLYYHSKTQVANPDLRPEHAVKAELGARYAKDDWQAALSAFYRYGTNTIDWVKPADSKDELWYSRQLTDIHAAGATAEAAYMPRQPLGHFLKQVRLSYSYIYMNKPEGQYLSKYALDYLRHYASLTIDHCIYGGVGASWQLSVRDRNGSFINREGIVEDYQPVLLLDGKIYYLYSWGKTAAKDKSVKVELQCTNMTNRRYYDVGGVLCPQHWVKAGVTLNL